MTDQELRALVASNAEGINETRQLVNELAIVTKQLVNELAVVTKQLVNQIQKTDKKVDTIANLVLQHNARIEALEHDPTPRKGGGSTASPTVPQAAKPRN